MMATIPIESFGALEPTTKRRGNERYITISALIDQLAKLNVSEAQVFNE